jgi:hypothetical protein
MPNTDGPFFKQLQASTTAREWPNTTRAAALRRSASRLGQQQKCSPRRVSIFFSPVLPGVMFDGRIIFDGIAIRQKLW